MHDRTSTQYFVSEQPEPVFLDTVHAGLHVFADSGDSCELKRYMVSRLNRDPENLKRHVQYIMALVDNGSNQHENLFAALCDLFIVLENKGLPLRRRMLAIAKNYLSDSDFSFLHAHLHKGLTAFMPLRKGNYSSLTRAYTGSADFIHKMEVPGKNVFSSLYEEAVSLLDYGDIEEAQVLLEKALKMQPDNAQIAAELVAIYQYQDDAEAMAGMAQWFISNNIALPECWPLL